MRTVPFAAAMLGATSVAHPALAQDQAARDADAVIGNCFGAPSDADRTVLRNVCLQAFDSAIVQAQRSDVHSPGRLNLYWAQGARAAGILVVLFVEAENGFGRRACTTAYRGWQSWNQVDAEFREDAGITVSQALQASVSHCEDRWNRGEWQ